MTDKPTYEELDQRVKELEKEAIKRINAEKALRESEARHRALFDNMIDGAAVYEAQNNGEDFIFVDINKAGEKISAITKDTVVGKSVLKMFPGVRDLGLLDTFKHVWSTGAQAYHPVARYKDNRISHWTENSVFKLPSGEIVAVYSDETERKQAEEALQAEIDKLETITQSIGAGLCIISKDYRTLWANKVLKQIFGEVEGKVCYETYNQQTNVCPNCGVREIFETGKEEVVHEEAGKDADGQTIWSEIIATPIRDKDGNIVSALELVVPITKRKQAEEKLKRAHNDLERRVVERTADLEKANKALKAEVAERSKAEEALRVSEVQFRTIFEVASVGIVQVDPRNGQMIRYNEKYRKITGYTDAELHVMKFPELTHPDDRQRDWDVFSRAVRGEIPYYQNEKRYVRKDGSIIWVRINAAFVRDDSGRPIRTVAICEDITERKDLEEQLRQSHKMEAIGTLAGGIAHDFNNMLGIILGNTELAMDDVPEWNPARLNLEEIKTASLRAKDVVRQLLSFARKTDQERKPVKINPIVTGALKLIRSSIPTSIEIRSNIPRDSAIILADPTQINQIMINLCTNAAHAMEEDGGVLEISLDSMTLDESTAQSYELSPGRYVKLTINDTGHGIDPEIKDRIFDPYFTTREVGEGSGMGLAVVHGIVMNHKGAISVDSEVGKGATFNIFLPIVEREPVPEVAIDEDLPTGKERVLFVDDEESIVKMGAQRLERLGYQVESTTSPLEALDLFRSKPDKFDLVITDLTMPKMTGDKLVKEILNIRLDMPIIICTGFSKKMDREKARAIGASGYLEKPHEKRNLAEMVRKVLDGKV